MSKLKLFIISANMLLVLLFFGFNIVKNEKVLSEGETVLLALRPVDPRSLMQGDYMRLRYSIGDSVITHNDTTYKYCVVRLDENKVASFVQLTNTKDNLQEKEILLRYNEGKSSWERYIYFGSDSYFFQEGTGHKYEEAMYGMLKVVTKGEMIGTCSLVGLCDVNKKLIE